MLRPPCPSTRRLWIVAVAGLAALAVSAAISPLANSQSPPAASPLDEPLRILADARQSYQNVRDYTCTMIKKERLNGQLQPDNVVRMKVRNQPFSVYLGWVAPKESAGQEACYVVGKYNGQMRVHSQGILGVVGFVTMATNDPRVLANTKHSITEAGIGNLITRFERTWQQERALGLTQTRVAEYEYNKRRCMRVETFHPDNRGGQFTSYRTVLYFDKENRLPIRIEVYDWPRQGGAADGELIEVYSYIDLRVNVGLGDEAFNY